MRHNSRFNLFSLFAVAALLLAAACMRDPMKELVWDDDSAVVRFTIQPEGRSAATRADANGGRPDGKVDYPQESQQFPHISDGTKADVLVYAVYNGGGELLPEFGQRERMAAEQGVALSDIPEEYLPDGKPLGQGQTLIKLGQNEAESTFPVKVELRVMRGETYKVAFWAQSSKCDAYDIQDLKRVQVHYKEYKDADGSDVAGGDAKTASVTPNNDEMRDAFCKVETLKIEKKDDLSRTVYLYRPLAQINVGTTGYDYETVVKDPEMRYIYSRMQIATGARYLDVVEDNIAVEDSYDNNSVFEFDYALIPAYINYEESEVADPEFNLANIKDLRQEFLKVHLYRTEDIAADLLEEYMPQGKDGFCSYADSEHDGKRTETFKWLSMAYVLVNSETNGDNTYKETTLNSVRVWLATDKEGRNAKEVVHVSNPHVTRNWRTNIVGDILTTDVTYQVVLDKNFAGDNNGFYQGANSGGDVVWSGPLNYDFDTNSSDGGAWYDAENDEILISSVSGLLWLQRMVNGKLVYTRENAGWSVKQTGSGGISHSDITVGDYIRYYDENGKSKSFGDNDQPDDFKPIEDPTVIVAAKHAKGEYKTEDEYERAMSVAKELKRRILRATHQDTNIGYNPDNNLSWPTNKNFHFVGTKKVKDGKKVPDPANVKLVADIDLSGIEWLGIGFDCRIGDTYDLLGDNMHDRSAKEQELKVVDKKLHRGFFGNFDGNGHTVSNLKTKRFSTEVHPDSWQQASYGPFEAVQWFARGFFGQLGGTATVKNLTLRNVDIYGNHCVGGIVGAAVGVGATEYIIAADGKVNGVRGGKEINIENCVVDGGIIKNEPMYRGDVRKQDNQQLIERDRTFARGVNTGGIVGLYNASGSITGCEVRNLTINGYRITGGIIGAITRHLEVYGTGDYLKGKRDDGDAVQVKRISGNSIHNTTILSDHFKPFDLMRREKYEYDYTPAGGTQTRYTANWAYGYAWNRSYSSFCRRLVGGDGGDAYEEQFQDNDINGSDVIVIDYACDTYPLEGKTITGRITDIKNATVEQLPVLNNWFVDIVNIKSNLIGTPSAYKRYKTHPFKIYSTKDTKVNLMWNLPDSYEIEWFDGRDKDHPYSGAVGMRVGAVTLKGVEDKDIEAEDEVRVLSVREVTGEKDCAMQISSCDRNQFKGGDKNDDDPWFTSAETTVANMIIRGNPYAYTGICLTPNECMSKITLSNLAIYDVYQTIALDVLERETGNVWPKEVKAEGVELLVNQSNLRGYTVPGAGWKSVAYTEVVFEQGSRIPTVTERETEYTCQVERTTNGTTFSGCTFKAPYIIGIATNANVSFEGTTTFVGDCTIKYGETEVPVPSGAYQKVAVKTDGSVTLTDMSGQETTVKADTE